MLKVLLKAYFSICKIGNYNSKNNTSIYYNYVNICFSVILYV